MTEVVLQVLVTHKTIRGERCGKGLVKYVKQRAGQFSFDI